MVEIENLKYIEISKTSTFSFITFSDCWIHSDIQNEFFAPGTGSVDGQYQFIDYAIK